MTMTGRWVARAFLNGFPGRSPAGRAPLALRGVSLSITALYVFLVLLIKRFILFFFFFSRKVLEEISVGDPKPKETAEAQLEAQLLSR